MDLPQEAHDISREAEQEIKQGLDDAIWGAYALRQGANGPRVGSMSDWAVRVRRDGERRAQAADVLDPFV
jgi:hypothetical protein